MSTPEIRIGQYTSGPPCKNCGGDPLMNHYCGGPCGGFGAVVEHSRKMQAYEEALQRWHGVHGMGPCPECLYRKNGKLRRAYRPKPVTFCLGCENCEGVGHQEPQRECPVCHNERAVLVSEWAIPPDPAATEPTKPPPLQGYESSTGEPAFGFLKGLLGRQIG